MSAALGEFILMLGIDSASRSLSAAHLILLPAHCLLPWLAGDWWHPKWWNADTKSGQAITLKNMEQVMPATGFLSLMPPLCLQ